jgi:Na+/proline symporter
MSDRFILWGIVIAYMAFVFVKGVLKVRKVGTSDDFLVAGRNVGWFFLFATMGATVIGGGYSIGAIGKTYEWGVLMLLVSTGGYFHFIFSGLVVAPQFRKAELYTVAGFFGHRFGERPRFVMLILSLLFSVFIVAAQMAAFGTVLTAILPQVSDATNILRWAIIIGGAMVVIYSTAGGLLAVINTDFYQFIVLFLGFIITLAFCIPDITGSYNSQTHKFIPTRFGSIDIVDTPQMAHRLLNKDDPLSEYIRSHLDSTQTRMLSEQPSDSIALSQQKYVLVNILNEMVDDTSLYAPARFADVNLSTQTREYLQNSSRGRNESMRLNLSLLQDAYREDLTKNRKIPEYFFNLHGDKGWLFLITTFLAFLLGETFAPGYATRYCIGKDVRHTKMGIAGVGFFLAFTFPVILFFIALYARIHFPDIDPQQALPMVVKQLHSPIIGGLIIGALLMAVMSSADSALNSSTAIFVKDLFEHQLGWHDKGDKKILVLARICSALLGITAILIAMLWSDIIGLLLFTYHLWAPAVILPVVVGAISKNRSRRMTDNIFITMLAAVGFSMTYRLVLFLYNKYDFAIFGEGVYKLMAQFDTSVFGVGISCLAFLLLTIITKSTRSDKEKLQA